MKDFTEKLAADNSVKWTDFDPPIYNVWKQGIHPHTRGSTANRNRGSYVFPPTRAGAPGLRANYARGCNIPPHAHGSTTDLLQDADDMKFTRTQAATDAGLSERQRKTALRVANVPQDEFEAAIESDAPPITPPVMLASKVHPTHTREHQNLTKPDTRGGLTPNSLPAASRALLVVPCGKFSTGLCWLTPLSIRPLASLS